MKLSFTQSTTDRNITRGLLILPLFLLVGYTAWAQAVISGKVTDEKGKPVPGATVYLDNTIDGATSDSTGAFKFSTEEKGAQTLVATSIGFENGGLPITIAGDMTGLSLKMKATAKKLDELIVTAGSFEASNRDKTILKPLDIVTTAGAQADVVRAIQTLPGTQPTGATAGLFVRGGDASEAAYIVDGLVAQNAFGSTPPGVAARSRFGPFQFKGVSFSSGGYSARYGEALSAVLDLNSNDQPDKSTINLGLNMAGVYASGSKLFEKTSIEGTAYYNNLTPFYGIAETNMDFYDVPKGGGGSAKFTYKPNKHGLFKAMVSYSQFSSGTEVANPTLGVPTSPTDTVGDQRPTVDYGLTNSYVNSIVSYRQMWKDKWLFYAAGSYSYNKDDAKWDGMPMLSNDDRTQVRAEVKNYTTSRLSILAGTEVQHFSYNREMSFRDTSDREYTSTDEFTETQVAGYVEAEWMPVNWLGIKPGVRYEHSALLKQDVVAPRMAIAIKAGESGQFSVASGVFYQTADPQYLLLLNNVDTLSIPKFQQSIHYIANYQWMKNDRTLRIEGYYKSYDQLVREEGVNYNLSPYRFKMGAVNNGGHGYAGGAELFWRDRKSIKNADYWISYSYIDTRRLYKNYLTETQPDFISTHTLNVVGKYFIEKLQTQINATYSYASGKPYNGAQIPDPSTFLNERTPEYHNLSIAVNYLTSIKKWFTVVYAGVDNITNSKNVFGYRWSGNTKYPIQPALYRSVFVGVNFSLTAFDKDEL